LLQCNTYVRTFERGSSPVHVCIDPGSQIDYNTVQSNIGALIGDVGELHSFSVNHQDPDVIGNVPFLILANPNISAIVTEDVWRLAQHLLHQPKRVHYANPARFPQLLIADRHRWQFVPTPFCHFRGAMAFYDPELRTLFSGDLFGGLNRLGQVHVVAEEADWAGVAQFHQVYMPMREALRYAVRQIRALQPAVEIIAPQHGHVITGELVPLFLERMHELLVGHDLLLAEEQGVYLAGYREVILLLVEHATELMGREEVMARLGSVEPQDGLGRVLTLHGQDLTLQREGYSAVVKVFSRLALGEPLDVVNQYRSLVLRACAERQIPIPPVGIGIEEGSVPEAVGPDGIRTYAWWMT
jgi:serine/threonine-protein kinase